MILRSAMAIVSLALALAFCWFGYDGTRGGIQSGSSIALIAGVGMFCYGLATLLLLLVAWVRRDPLVRRLALLAALVPLVLSLVSFGEGGFKPKEWIGLAEITGLLALHVLALGLVARAFPGGRAQA